MASAILALANPIYRGIQAETDFVEKNPNLVGAPGSVKRLKSIGYGFREFGKGFIGAGGIQGTAKLATSKSGGMIGGGLDLGSPMVLGHLPGMAHQREYMRGGSDARRPAYG